MQRFGLLAAMALCLVVLFGVRIGFLHYGQIPPLLSTEQVHVDGVVVNDPEVREFSLHAEVWLISGQKILAILPRGSDLAYNDHVVLEGKLTAPEDFVTDTGRIFEYEKYLRVRGISSLMRYATLLEREPGDRSFFGTLYAIKHNFSHSLERVLPEPQAALFGGILLGERRGLPEPLTAAFIAVGLIHIVVLSGYNISIVGEAVLRALSFLPRRISFLLGALFMLLFVLMTGASSTSVRACIMALIAIMARYLKRPAAALRALVLAAMGMLFWNPLLVFDPGFVLSVTATFGLITLGETFEKWLYKIPVGGVLNIRAIAASTLAVQVFILPALLYFTGVLSLIALPANVLVLPLVPLTMLAGFVSGICGLVYPALAIVPAFVTDTLLRYTIFVAEVGAWVPLSSLTIPAFPGWVALLVYFPLSVLAIAVFRRNAARSPTN